MKEHSKKPSASSKPAERRKSEGVSAATSKKIGRDKEDGKARKSLPAANNDQQNEAASNRKKVLENDDSDEEAMVGPPVRCSFNPICSPLEVCATIPHMLSHVFLEI